MKLNMSEQENPLGLFFRRRESGEGANERDRQHFAHI